MSMTEDLIGSFLSLTRKTLTMACTASHRAEFNHLQVGYGQRNVTILSLGMMLLKISVPFLSFNPIVRNKKTLAN